MRRNSPETKVRRLLRGQETANNGTAIYVKDGNVKYSNAAPTNENPSYGFTLLRARVRSLLPPRVASLRFCQNSKVEGKKASVEKQGARFWTGEPWISWKMVSFKVRTMHYVEWEDYTRHKKSHRWRGHPYARLWRKTCGWSSYCSSGGFWALSHCWQPSGERKQCYDYLLNGVKTLKC